MNKYLFNYNPGHDTTLYLLSGTPIKECDTSADCKRSECCVSYVHPIGKRAADVDNVTARGKCMPLGKKGSGNSQEKLH